MRRVAEFKKLEREGNILYERLGCSYRIDYSYNQTIETDLFPKAVTFSASGVENAGFMIAEGRTICTKDRISKVVYTQIPYDFESKDGRLYPKGTLLPVTSNVYPFEGISEGELNKLPVANLTRISYTVYSTVD